MHHRVEHTHTPNTTQPPTAKNATYIFLSLLFFCLISWICFGCGLWHAWHARNCAQIVQGSMNGWISHAVGALGESVARRIHILLIERKDETTNYLIFVHVPSSFLPLLPILSPSLPLALASFCFADSSLHVIPTFPVDTQEAVVHIYIFSCVQATQARICDEYGGISRRWSHAVYCLEYYFLENGWISTWKLFIRFRWTTTWCSINRIRRCFMRSIN